jgi:hypothetical protein
MRLRAFTAVALGAAGLTAAAPAEAKSVTCLKVHHLGIARPDGSATHRVTGEG